MNRCCLLDVVQKNGVAGSRVGDHRRVAAIQARVPIRCTGQSKSGLDRRKARFSPLHFTGEVGSNWRNRDWPGQCHSIHRVARAQGQGSVESVPRVSLTNGRLCGAHDRSRPKLITIRKSACVRRSLRGDCELKCSEQRTLSQSLVTC